MALHDFPSIKIKPLSDLWEALKPQPNKSTPLRQSERWPLSSEKANRINQQPPPLTPCRWAQGPFLRAAGERASCRYYIWEQRASNQVRLWLLTQLSAF